MKKKSKRIVRSLDERIAHQKLKLANMEARKSLNAFHDAVKHGLVAKKDVPEYRRILRSVKTMEKASKVFSDNSLDVEALVADELRSKLILKLGRFLSKSKTKKKSTKKKAKKKSPR